jgi:hypothetical protein
VTNVSSFGSVGRAVACKWATKDMTMKIFDWKRREEWQRNPSIPEGTSRQ